ncbi:2-amino-4-hydroxy-6-hydroxymethyldihydropteridine diphosphokinase [Ruixingdingia sedimenti]|uniref:2-amino-4-hydroxy-6-hydroxymethyldihydropteridine pyrophosphokinase n=1 Tax=Ruixingdingia sedimenti TaxID=3073604 RepID=A0ABU1F8D7_9RHOB|nr:2-amino-4-hydroxy-6-hydroxymethyldihydropteridine diphosphokinase [Xinfangfangia sp. LG-4]MDR5653121.1 2-amino-4-hydroxy-6-hydroxymethyldihydropteridine diphosphokinase [Xinfangfangia sp. LG-4]
MRYGSALIALGANLPHAGRTPAQTLRAALAALRDAGFVHLRESALYATPCFPPGAGPDYVNACAVADWAGDAAAALAALHGVEAAFGRSRAERWGMRTLDLDLIALDDAVLPDRATWAHWAGLPPAEQARAAPDRLVLPHPRLADRAFVLVPLAEVAPLWRHPVTGRTVAGMLAALPAADRAAVVPIGPRIAPK